jgi:hypothetical protein
MGTRDYGERSQSVGTTLAVALFYSRLVSRQVNSGTAMQIDILPTAKAGGFPPSRVSFPASLEVAAQAPRGSIGLTPPPQASTFPIAHR